ncbi:MAG: class I SAM-dependent methyltransferase [Bdellovibrionaceae bacterium]|nr:class I SAM-dependent methyltransferase [Pseudobdellovibrionaceae bacterium]
MKIGFHAEESQDFGEIKQRASAFGLDLVSTETDYRLTLDKEACLRLEDAEGRKLVIDFDAAGPDYHRKAIKGKQELLARAVGSRQGVRRVLDLSAGLAQDAVFLSQLGFEVTAVERHPLLAFLLSEAKRKTSRPELRTLNFLWSEASALVTADFLSKFDAVYFDPMYPSKKKSALPRQEMLLFRGLVGKDEDAGAIVEKLVGIFSGRLVIKRPLEAPPLIRPTHSFSGKTVRYDVTVRSL